LAFQVNVTGEPAVAVAGRSRPEIIGAWLSELPPTTSTTPGPWSAGSSQAALPKKSCAETHSE
jgi:hypothetical protein